ncbi:plasmid recombination protein (plasmid) [Fusobacterium animalis]|uniref:plasmid recombination protein n=1 Tax=Fusobacterium animalis TaxID=76859 RepID=UPI0030D419DD
MSNNISVSMHIGSGKNAINNLEKIKRADLHNNRKYKNNRNQEIDLSLSKYNITIAGTKNITNDIKEFYKKEFSEAVYNYNKNQKDERRKIVDYLEKMDKDSKSNIGTEFIFQIGDREDWENKSLEDKQKTVEIFKKAIPILEEKGIKTVNASLHLDETSPHLHLIAVPVIENQKRGLEKQVSQNKVITKEIIKEIRSKVEKVFIEEYNKIYGTNKELKKGSEIPEHLQVQDYKDTKKVLEVAKKITDKEILKEKVSTDLLKVSKEIEKLEKEKKEKDNIKKILEDEVKNIDIKNKEYKEKLDKNKNNLEVSTANITEEIKELESKSIEIKKIKEAKEKEFEKEFLYKANKIKEIEDLKKEIEEKEIELKELEEKRKAEEKKKNDFIAEEQERKKRYEEIDAAIEKEKEKLKNKELELQKVKKTYEDTENARLKSENDIKLANKEIEDNKIILEKTNAEIKKLNVDIETAIKNKEKLEVEKEKIKYTEEEAREDIIKLIENKNDDFTIIEVENIIDDFTHSKNNKILNTVAEEVKRVLPNFVENVDGYRKIVSENFRENINDVFLKTGNIKSINKNNNTGEREY